MKGIIAGLTDYSFYFYSASIHTNWSINGRKLRELRSNLAGLEIAIFKIANLLAFLENAK